MRFFTFQPYEVLSQTFLGQKVPDKPILCQPFLNAFYAWADSFWLAPINPECFIIFESDDYHSEPMQSLVESSDLCNYYVDSIDPDKIIMYRVLPTLDNLPRGLSYFSYIISGSFYRDLCDFFKIKCDLPECLNVDTVKLISNYVLDSDICHHLINRQNTCAGDMDIIRSRLYNCVFGYAPISMGSRNFEETL